MTLRAMAAAVDWLAYRARDIEAILKMFADDAVVECNCGGMKIITGKEGLRAYWKGRLKIVRRQAWTASNRSMTERRSPISPATALSVRFWNSTQADGLSACDFELCRSIRPLRSNRPVTRGRQNEAANRSGTDRSLLRCFGPVQTGGVDDGNSKKDGTRPQAGPGKGGRQPRRRRSVRGEEDRAVGPGR
jgi:hypothetical protein